jgi:hypothetical protein
MDEEVAGLLLNGMPLKQFIVFYLVAVGGALIFFLHNLYTSIKVDSSTPMTFQWKYFIKGLIRVIMSLVSLAFGIIFFTDISLIIFATDQPVELNALSAFLMGVGVDRLWKGLLGVGEETRRAVAKRMTR